ncbi:MAGUK p55 subfamily member 7-like isoform X3 [Anneissia japonica]|uniref:MAGUK p55 subfamily member 7-like isoform X3 n=1 Tax=Anneissia japonica TaxID=1529436 RepID=UPI001425B63D|nr:MAGUK p55 subfamily member 7-like isoform X3 [Anneissia japonica]
MIETAFVEHTREMPGVSIPAKKDLGLQRLLTSLDYICGRLQGRPDDMQFLNEVLHSPDFQSLLKVHYKIEEQHNKEPPLPVINSAAMLALEVSQDITEYPLGQDAEELGLILQSPLMQMILHVHDRIATKEFYPKLQEVEADMSDGDDSMKIVRLVKSNEPLGATITCDERTGSVKIARIMHSGAADRSGLIHVNDEVVEVDGIRVKGKTPDEVVSLLSSINGTITFKLIPANAISNGALESQLVGKEKQVRVKAFFNFDPDVDRSIPCVEAGLPFKKGDILHIVAQDDPQWWQARIEGDPEMRTGLIPGKVLQERREALSRSLLPTQSPTPSLKSVPGGRASSVNSVPSSPDLNFRRAQSLRLSTRSTTSLRSNLSSRSSLRIPNKKKTKKIMYQSIQNHNYDVDEILIYEEVTLFRAPPERPRPLVIVGPPGVGKNELKKRLMASKPFHFKSTIPHTSRPKKLLETNGKEYIFISKEEFERNIRLNKFVEWGEYKGNMYGTSLDSVRGAILAAKVAILIVCPPALKLLKASDVKPYVIFIKPPSFQRLKSSRMASKAVYTMEKKQTKSFTDEEFMDMIESGIRMEANYGHYFDCTIVNEDLTTAYNELIATAMRIEREPQWVPSSWMR